MTTLIKDILVGAGIQCEALPEIQLLGGGSINQVYKVNTSSGMFCVKLNSASRYPDMFDKEADGLIALDVDGGPLIPRPISAGVVGDQAYLLLEFIQEGSLHQNFWDQFGEAMANLHRYSANSFGWEENNYIGSLHQFNDLKESWAEFFGLCRIEPQLKLAIENNRIDTALATALEKLITRLSELLPDESAALIHGDLWSGNFMCGPNGEPCIYDPAVYYGSREMDIAMSKLFGGFDNAFYDAYNHHFPMERGWQNRIDLHNLYPLLVHVNLFGGGYVNQVKSIVSKYV